MIHLPRQHVGTLLRKFLELIISTIWNNPSKWLRQILKHAGSFKRQAYVQRGHSRAGKDTGIVRRWRERSAAWSIHSGAEAVGRWVLGSNHQTWKSHKDVQAGALTRAFKFHRSNPKWNLEEWLKEKCVKKIELHQAGARLAAYWERLKKLEKESWETSNTNWRLEHGPPFGVVVNTFKSYRKDPKWPLNDWLRMDCQTGWLLCETLWMLWERWKGQTPWSRTLHNCMWPLPPYSKTGWWKHYREARPKSSITQLAQQQQSQSFPSRTVSHRQFHPGLYTNV